MENKSVRYEPLPKWSELTYAGEKRLPPSVSPETGSWPMYFLRSSGKGRFTDSRRRAVNLDIAHPSTIDFAGEQLKEVKDTLNRLTETQITIAKYWDAGPPTKQWTPIVDRLVDTYSVPAPQAARILAAVHAGISDTFVATWYLKYSWQVPRPNQLDQELATLLCTPYHPSYPAGHATVAGCTQVILSYFFPTQADRLEVLAKECAASRIYGGVHYPADCTEGLRLGRQIGSIAVDYLKNQTDGDDKKIDKPITEHLPADLAPPPYKQAIPYHYKTKCTSKRLTLAKKKKTKR
ncbi:vanadium-dependent haloperoxidase [Aneurinibacillus tyrosinisolvens]|uniref:vanadium-dependent haloperoxidase n=1 Tax=Aneurinibacillus tyrosinisolvens TaxID=1443435 RepID=UPI000A4852A7|nr:vanadium-dependent haloperoxidase [Aneurinibacillus tyrosinisolvens]